MVRNILIALSIAIGVFLICHNLGVNNDQVQEINDNCRELCGIVQNGETFFDIFRKHRLSFSDFLKLKEAAADVHRLRKLQPGNEYRIVFDKQNGSINSMSYRIDDDYILSLEREEAGFVAEKICIEYKKRVEQIGGAIRDNLISSIGEDREKIMLALQLSDIFAWDIDFTSGVRKDDTFRIVVEGLYLDGEFRKYGNILAAEFVNDEKVFRAYRYEHHGKADYYDGDGKSLRKSFLKAPLSFRHISSTFSNRRFHPILGIYRPHHGIDYSAPVGTPVSAVGDGKVVFSGYKGNYGNLVVIKHLNNWRTYYGHLSKINRGLRNGKKIQQGQVIGYVGATGLATGPHLHYEMRVHNKPVNPSKVKMPQGKSIPQTLLSGFRNFTDQMDNRLAAIALPYYAEGGKDRDNKI